MYKPKLLFALLLLCSGLYIACNKDNLNSSGPQATVTFAGRILDENGQAIQGAQVRVEGESASTDKNGVFRLKPVRVDADNAIVFVNKIGYFDFSRAHIVQNNAILNLTIQLLKKQQAGTINASAGGNINLVNGARLSFPANAIADKTGSAYTGTVRVYARYLDPSDPELAYKMPGDLRGINAEGAAQILSTFGMMAVELESQAQTFNIQNNNLDAGDIQVCNGLSEFIQYTLDGQFFTKVDPGCGIESDSMPNGGFYTQISALEPTSFGTFISFNSNNQPGTFAIDGMRIDTFEIDFANSNLSTKVTTAPAVVGDPIIGTFGTSFKDIYGNAHTISGSYRVIRDY